MPDDILMGVYKFEYIAREEMMKFANTWADHEPKVNKHQGYVELDGKKWWFMTWPVYNRWCRGRTFFNIDTRTVYKSGYPTKDDWRYWIGSGDNEEGHSTDV